MANEFDRSLEYTQSTGKSVSKLITAKDLEDKLQSLKRARSRLENQWKLNLAFYKGQQYTYFNRTANRIESLPVEDGEKPRYRVRLTSNQIMVGAQSLLAKYTKTKPNMFATPGSSSDHDYKAAEMSEHLLEYWWTDLCLDEKLKEALLWGIVAGQGYWKVTWDDQAGKQMRFTLDPISGQPIVDQTLKEAYSAEMARFNLQPEETVVYMGDVKVEVLSPFDLYLDPSAKTLEDCKYVICNHNLTPDEIHARYGVELSPDSVLASPEATLPFDNAQDAETKEVKRISVGYFKPHASLPQGRVVTWTDKTILDDQPWYYPFNNLPIVKFPGVRIPGNVYDSSVVEHAIPLQKELNRTLSQIVEYKNLTLKPRVFAPLGSMRERITDEPGRVYQYSPQFGQKPETDRLPDLPNYAFEILQNISERLDRIFSITEVTEGGLPSNLEAGIAIDLLQEIASDRIAPTIQDVERSLAMAGSMMIKYAQQYYIEPRLLKIIGSGGQSQVMRFTQADITGEIDVNVEAGSGLPRTRAGRQARIAHLLEMGLIQPHQAYKHMDMADLKSVQAMFKIDEDEASREHDTLLNGSILNPDSAQQAAEMVAAGINPETGEVLTEMDDIMGIVFRAGMQPLVHQNHHLHLETHGKFMKSSEFRNLPEDIRQAFILHYDLTQMAIMAIPVPGEPPKVTLQLKSVVGPTAQARLLEKSGIQITPAESAEPPLETWISDSKDKPNVDDRPGQPNDYTKLGKELYRAIIKATEKGGSSKAPNPQKGIKS